MSAGWKGQAMPGIRADFHLALGASDQYLLVVPLRKAVIMRLGRTADGHAFDLDRPLFAILATSPRLGGTVLSKNRHREVGSIGIQASIKHGRNGG
jgi:hypothetical protein